MQFNIHHRGCYRMTDIFHYIIKWLTFIHCSCPCRNRYIICFHFTYLHAFVTLICGIIIFIQINMVNSPKKQGSCSSRRKDCPFMKEQEAWIILFFGMTKSCTLVRMKFKKVYKCPPEGSVFQQDGATVHTTEGSLLRCLEQE